MIAGHVPALAALLKSHRRPPDPGPRGPTVSKPAISPLQCRCRRPKPSVTVMVAPIPAPTSQKAIPAPKSLLKKLQHAKSQVFDKASLFKALQLYQVLLTLPKLASVKSHLRFSIAEKLYWSFKARHILAGLKGPQSRGHEILLEIESVQV